MVEDTATPFAETPLPDYGPTGRTGGEFGLLLVGLCLLLLLVGTWFDGAFSLLDWAPLAIFALSAVVVLGAGGRVRAASHGFAALLGVFALWSALSVLWSDSPSTGAEIAARQLLYAGLATIVVVAVRQRASAMRLADAYVVGLGALVAVTLTGLAVSGGGMLLAGRLNQPVGYRNGAAAVMAMAAVALLCAAAPRQRRPITRGVSFSLAVSALGLSFLAQSRGVVLGLAAGLALALVLGPDRLRRVFLALAAIALVAAVSGPLLDPYDAFLARSFVTDDEVAGASGALGLVALIAFLAMTAVALLDSGLRPLPLARRWLRPAGLTVLAVGCLAGAGLAWHATGSPLSYAAGKLDEFKMLEPTQLGATRIGSTGGQRYDLWRIAYGEFADAPITGAGEGSFPTRYYRDRATDRNLTVPHSLPLGVLGDTGIVGLALLVGAFASVAAAVAKRWRHLEAGVRRRASALLAAGSVLVVQATVDWLWTIAALTGLAILAVALGLRLATAGDGVEPEASPRQSLSWRLVAAAAVIALACLFVSATYVRVARAHQGADRLAAARVAERFAPFALDPRYLQAGALESAGRTDAARTELRGALELEPRSFVTAALLGDLEYRAGNLARARSWYRRALGLNPVDSGLRSLTHIGA